jgi:hypothetical protein
VRLPRASVRHSRKQWSGVVRASGMAESESAGIDESPLPSYFFSCHCLRFYLDVLAFLRAKKPRTLYP